MFATAGNLTSLLALAGALVMVPGADAGVGVESTRYGPPAVELRLVADGLTVPVTLVRATDRAGGCS